jgi:hypothetical protein
MRLRAIFSKKNLRCMSIPVPSVRRHHVAWSWPERDAREPA